MRIGDRYRLFQFYYLATPIFVLVDIIYGTNIRVAALEQYPVLKYLYYILCMGCAVATRAIPRLSAVVALIESSVNILLLILGVFIPYYQLIQQLMSNQTVVENKVITTEIMTNFMISGTIWVISFFRNPLIRGTGHHNKLPN